ncbi:serine hydrolase [Lacihabitans lacunae]|uniref:beta-lactamase n=1 Tax=Lacihabitans lacunae TaxID=1028214 RepID=A0ABV7YUG0_9BACT
MPKNDNLKNKISNLINAQEGDFAFSFYDLNTKTTFGIHDKNEFHAASTMKTPVMIEVFKQIKEGNLKLEDSILIKNEFRSIVDKSPYKMDIGSDSDDVIYKKIGIKMSVYDLVYQMITVSSNLATNILIDIVDPKKVTQSMRDLGAMDIQVRRGVEDTKAFDLGLNNTTTAHDLMLIFKALANKEIGDLDYDKMIGILADQKFNEIIPAKLPKNLKIAHKTGSITGVQHDSGIVFLPDGRSYVLIVLSKNLKDVEKGVDILSEISKMIYTEFYTKN